MENSTFKLNKGDNTPEFRLTDTEGKNFSLSEALKEGSSLFFIFCHGMGCDVCASRLPEIQENLARFEDRGLRPVVITDKPLDYNKELKEHLGLGFSILSDDGTVAEQYGVVENDKIKTTMMIVDRHGMIDWIYVGQCEPNPDWPTLEYIFRHMVMAKGV
jgi:peroxiredoxin